MKDFYNYVWRYKLQVWLCVFTFCLVTALLINWLFYWALGSRPNWFWIAAYSSGWPNAILIMSYIKKGK